MGSTARIYVTRLARLVVLGPFGESIGKLRDVVISLSIAGRQPRVLGLVIELPTRRRIFVPILRVSSFEPNAITLNTGNVSLTRFTQRPEEVLVLGQVLDTKVRVNDPSTPELANVDLTITDLGIEQHRSRDWVVTRVAVSYARRLAHRTSVHVVPWEAVQGLTLSALSTPDQDVTHLLQQFQELHPSEVADALRELPPKRRHEVIRAFDNARLADILQELPEEHQTRLFEHLGPHRSADVLEEMDPDDAADVLGSMPAHDAEALLAYMDPDESDPVRRLLKHSPDTAGGLMTSSPLVVTPDTSIAEALAKIRNPDLNPALASLVFVCRSPTSTPTGQYLGCVTWQRLLCEPPANLIAEIVDRDFPRLCPEVSLADLTRYFAAYNLVCGPVLDHQGHLVGAVTVDDVLDHLLPDDWRDNIDTTRWDPRRSAHV